jgi:hypothetical protein
MVNKQPVKLGPGHAGKLVTVVIEETCYRRFRLERPRRMPCPQVDPVRDLVRQLAMERHGHIVPPRATHPSRRAGESRRKVAKRPCNPPRGAVTWGPANGL